MIWEGYSNWTVNETEARLVEEEKEMLRNLEFLPDHPEEPEAVMGKKRGFQPASTLPIVGGESLSDTTSRSNQHAPEFDRTGANGPAGEEEELEGCAKTGKKQRFEDAVPQRDLTSFFAAAK